MGWPETVTCVESNCVTAGGSAANDGAAKSCKADQLAVADRMLCRP
jgi:hypothetical protein